LTVPSPETFVSGVIDTLGVSSRTTGYWGHGLQHYFSSNYFCFNLLIHIKSFSHWWIVIPKISASGFLFFILAWAP
jgi:hypothetical protein